MSNIPIVSPDRYSNRRRQKRGEKLVQLHQEIMYPTYGMYLKSQEREKIELSARMKKTGERTNLSYAKGEYMRRKKSESEIS